MFIDVHNVTKTFGHDSGLVIAIRDVTFSIREGENVAIYGPSGSGKSTLLNVLCGLLHPDSGTILVDKIDLYADLKSDGLARFRSEYIGFVFQAFNLIPYLTAFENVILPLAHLDLRRREKHEMAQSVLEKVGLADRMRHLPSELSGGQQQRVAIARALVNEPPIIVADEPTGNLDRDTSKEILGLFSRLNDEGHTIVSVTHDDSSLAFTDRQICMVDGNIERVELPRTS